MALGIPAKDFILDAPELNLQSHRKRDLIELHLTYCNNLSAHSLRTLTRFRQTLVSLSLFGCSRIFYRKGGAPLVGDEEEEEERPASRQAPDTDFSFQGFNRLRLLNLGGLPEEVDAEALLKPLPALTSLDLSGVPLPKAAFLAHWKERLASLVLYNVDLSEELINTVVELGHLSIEPCKSSIYPFQELKRPLQFLGLYNTTLCNVTHIPAYKAEGVSTISLNSAPPFPPPHQSQVQRNCCLTLCNFSIPEELEFQYGRVNLLLLKILEPVRQDESIQRIAVHLCNALVCQVDNHHKEAVGKMGFVKVGKTDVSKKPQDRMCDQVMEFSWSALWNITDETPDNCQMFLNCKGMSLFLDCLKEFPDKQELHRNMLGLLGNVAEVRALRPQLLTPQFISDFR
uniref:protein zer-1 homolog n=1 Tax=Oncorhynchus gorbuscha TaxID=8017 RepID=UPI001EAF0CF5|nr:protein zer-1 homolog [Oncorhynchus gorbuscha]